MLVTGKASPVELYVAAPRGQGGDTLTFQASRFPEGVHVIVLGVILIIVGLVVESLKILLTIGVILLVVGLILNFVPIGGRRRRFY